MISISPSLAPSHFYSWKLLSLEWPLLAPFSHHPHVRFSLFPLFLCICSIFIPKRLLAFRSTYYTDHLTISSYSISHLWIPLIMSFPLIVRHGASPKLRLSSVPTRYFWQEWQGGLRSPVPDSSSPAPHPVQDGIGLKALSRRCKSQIENCSETRKYNGRWGFGMPWRSPKDLAWFSLHLYIHQPSPKGFGGIICELRLAFSSPINFILGRREPSVYQLLESVRKWNFPSFSFLFLPGHSQSVCNRISWRICLPMWLW